MAMDAMNTNAMLIPIRANRTKIKVHIKRERVLVIEIQANNTEKVSRLIRYSLEYERRQL